MMARHYFMKVLDAREEKYQYRAEPAKELKNSSNRMMKIKSQLPKKFKDKLIRLFYTNTNVFTWLASNMSGIPPKVITHKLNANPYCCPICPKRRSFASQR